MGGAAAGGRAFPVPGVAGSSFGINPVQAAQAPAQQPNLRPMQPLNAAAPLTPMTPSMGRALQPGQAAFPVAQSPLNPWGVGRGGSGMIPTYRRPGTMPEVA